MKRTIPLLLLLAGFLAIAALGLSRLLGGAGEYRAGEQAYQALSQYVQHQPGAARAAPEPEEEMPDLPTDPEDPADAIDWPQVDFQALQAINPQIVAWICLEGTPISYPIVLGPDNSYYLNRLYDGTVNSAGTLFVDYRNAGDFSDRNTVVYGHNLQSGAMLAAITGYKEQGFYEAHPRALLMTPQGNYTLEFFAGYVTHITSQAWKLSFGSDEEFSQWAADSLARSTFQGPVVPTGQDRILTLSTCTYEYDDARYVLLAVLKECK